MVTCVACGDNNQDLWPGETLVQVLRLAVILQALVVLENAVSGLVYVVQHVQSVQVSVLLLILAVLSKLVQDVVILEHWVYELFLQRRQVVGRRIHEVVLDLQSLLDEIGV